MILLSYPLSRSTPLYPGTPPIEIGPARSMRAGDSANTSRLAFSNHSSTHVDTALHFHEGAKDVVATLRPHTTFRPLVVLEVPSAAGSVLAPDRLAPHANALRDAEALLLRTGFGSHRGTPAYLDAGPILAPELGPWLRHTAPKLRLVGLDAISIGSPRDRERSRAAHRELLGGSDPFLLLEDVDLRDDRLLAGKWTLHLFPWVYEHVDGTPVTAVATEHAP